MKTIILFLFLSLNLFAQSGLLLLMSDDSAVTTPPVDTLGTELFLNPTMEANSDWTSAFADVSERSNTRSHGGTYSWKTVTSAGGGTQQVVTVENGKEYWIQGYVWLVAGAIFKMNTDAGQLDLYVNGSSTPVSDFDAPTGEWVHVKAKHTATDTETFVRFNAATATTEYYIDDCSMKELLP